MGRLIYIFLALFVLLLSGCLSKTTSWTWVHPDAEYAELNREKDIDDCEEVALEQGIGRPMRLQTARSHGDWGDSNFEFCMGQRDWKLQQIEEPAQ